MGKSVPSAGLLWSRLTRGLLRFGFAGRVKKPCVTSLVMMAAVSMSFHSADGQVKSEKEDWWTWKGGVFPQTVADYSGWASAATGLSNPVSWADAAYSPPPAGAVQPITPEAGSINATWTGLGSDNNWTTAANWLNSAPPDPVNTMAVIHFGASARTTPYDNENMDYFGNIIFDAGAPSYSLNGETIRLYNQGGSAGVRNNSSAPQTVNFAAINPDSDTQFLAYAGDLTVLSPISPHFNSATLTAEAFGGHTLTFNNTIADTGTYKQTLEVSGAGTVILAGTNTYTGNTTVVASGTLIVNGSIASGSAVQIDTGTTLSGTGTVNGSVLINDGLLSPGPSAATGSVGTLTTGAITLGRQALFDVDGASNYDHVIVNGRIFYGGLLVIDLGTYQPTGTTSYTLFTATSEASGFSDDNSVFIDQPGYTGIFDPTTGVLTLSVAPVPEPSTWFCGALALGAIACSRRRPLHGRENRGQSGRRIEWRRVKTSQGSVLESRHVSRENSNSAAILELTLLVTPDSRADPVGNPRQAFALGRAAHCVASSDLPSSAWHGFLAKD